jgi:AcrR family transcriptional regulator
VTTDQSTTKTRERLLEAAAHLFAEKGYKATTIRDICRRAGANIASVNYHFDNKRHLYDAVIRTAVEFALHSYPPAPTRPLDLTPEERLHQFILAFLRRRLDGRRPGWQRQILTREMADPGPGTRALVADIVERNHRLLENILQAVLAEAGLEATDRQMHHIMASIVGQCLFYQPGHFALQIINEHLDLSPAGVDDIARHITSFTLAAIRELARQ